jgi:hypothetical protein
MNTIHRTGEISGFRSEIVTVDGIRVHYWRGGDAGGQPVLTLTRPFGGDVAEAEPLPYRKPPAHELKGGQGRSGVSIRAGPQRARGAGFARWKLVSGPALEGAMPVCSALSLLGKLRFPAATKE